jgi:peptidoglycan lytic transglycosylase
VHRKFFPALLALLSIAGCMNNPFQQTAVKRDGPPLDEIDVSTIADAVPRLDPITVAGNKNPYTINGKTYHLLPSAIGYREVGMASWYGTKFHGNPTSNGETYSLYGMTAAHKTLPIPAYARVKNLNNNRSVIVRINDRGPFHSDRIIDLSYAAAKKLGYAESGTARVEVSVIDPIAYQNNSVQAPSISVETDVSPTVSGVLNPENPEQLPSNTFLQVGAFASYKSASQRREQVSELTTYPVVINEVVNRAKKKSLFKVFIGPVGDLTMLRQLSAHLRQLGRFQSFVVNDLDGID